MHTEYKLTCHKQHQYSKSYSNLKGDVRYGKILQSSQENMVVNLWRGASKVQLCCTWEGSSFGGWNKDVVVAGSATRWTFAEPSPERVAASEKGAVSWCHT